MASEKIAMKPRLRTMNMKPSRKHRINRLANAANGDEPCVDPLTAPGPSVKWPLVLFCIAAFVFMPSAASAFTNIVTFGDSLSDNGTSATDSYGITIDSNGPVWADYLANSSHFNISQLDLAYVGATTGTDNPSAASHYGAQSADTGMMSQVSTYLALTDSNISSNSLVALWGGADDLFQGRTYTAAVSNIGTEVQELEGAGAKNFLLLNLPNIGATPYFQSLGTQVSGSATAWCQAFDADLSTEVTTLQSQAPGDHFYTFDVYSFLTAIDADPSAYGFSSLSAVYWTDGLHPSTQTHSLLADDVYAQIEGVPEPGSVMLLLMAGLPAIAFFAFKARRATNPPAPP